MSFAELTPVASCSSSSMSDSSGALMLQKTRNEFHRLIHDLEFEEEHDIRPIQEEKDADLILTEDEDEEEELEVKYPYQRKNQYEGLAERIQQRLNDSGDQGMEDRIDEMLLEFKTNEAKLKFNKTLNSYALLDPSSSIFTCVLCSKAFSDSQQLQQHVQKNHDLSEHKERCKLCGKAYKLRKNLRAHMALHNKDFQCTKCDLVFQTEKTLENHVQKWHSEDLGNGKIDEASLKVICNLCGSMFPQETLKRHQYYCENKKQIAEKRAIKKAQSVPSSPAYQSAPGTSAPKISPKDCPICEKSFATRQSMIRHAKLFHPEHRIEEKMPVYEPKCLSNPVVFTAPVYSPGASTGSPAASYRDKSCRVCGEQFASRQSMLRHVGRKHPEVKDDPNVTAIRYVSVESPAHQYACTECGKRLTSLTALNYHRARFHTDAPRTKCPHCPKSYTVPSELRKHIQRKHGEGSEEPVDRPDVEELPDIPNYEQDDEQHVF